ncbi:MAG: hypothetical protein IJB74_05610 [Clostridia bacterium]|nr:hypothetical protein [Clostridia bacterium]
MSIDNKKLKSCPRITDTSVTDKGEIRIRWTEVPGTDKYAVKRSETPDGEFELVAWEKGTEYIDKSVKKDITYWYRIVALKVLKGKRNSKKMSPVAARVISSVPAAEKLKITGAGMKIKLEWVKPENVSSFLVYRRNEYFDQLMPVCKVTEGSFIDRDVVGGQIYHYSVQSLDGNRQGNFSREVSCVCLDSGEILSVKSHLFKKVDLKVRIVAGADGYIFERSTDGESFDEVGKTDSDVSVRYTDKADKAFTAYYYRVKAYKKVGEKTFISKPSKSVRVKTK